VLAHSELPAEISNLGAGLVPLARRDDLFLDEAALFISDRFVHEDRRKCWTKMRARSLACCSDVQARLTLWRADSLDWRATAASHRRSRLAYEARTSIGVSAAVAPNNLGLVQLSPVH
jgi:hypothetical protein